MFSKCDIICIQIHFMSEGFAIPINEAMLLWRSLRFMRKHGSRHFAENTFKHLYKGFILLYAT